MGEILKKYAHVLDSGIEQHPQNEKLSEAVPSQSGGFVPYAESGGRKKPGAFYSDKPEADVAGYASSGRGGGGGGRKEMEGEVYRQTKAADVDAEKAFERMTYSGTGGGPKRKKSVYAHD